MKSPRVIIALDMAAAWSRGILMGFATVAHESNWTLLHYHPDMNLDWLLNEWQPAAVVLPPGDFDVKAIAKRGPIVVSVNADRSREGIASVVLDEAAIAEAAALHLHARGLRNLTSFRFADAPFAIARERRFAERARELKAQLSPGWWTVAAESGENPAALMAWLRALPKPCGVFAGSDRWARVVGRYCKVSGIRVPEEIALIGVDNDLVECELQSPPLSSVAIPWRTLGQEAAQLVQRGLANKPIAGRTIVVSPHDVIARRSTEIFAIDDPLVSNAVHWICDNAARRISVASVVRATGASRQRLERRFRAELGRTIMQEVRRARVNKAKQLLTTTALELSRVAKLSGFTTPAQFSVAFTRELGQSPSNYRRAFRLLQHDED